MPEKIMRVGGSFAPALTHGKLVEYTELARGAQEQIKDAMLLLIDMVTEYLDVPPSASSGPVKPHMSGRGLVVELGKDVIERLWNYVPWKEELEMFSVVFDKIDPATQANLRNAAFHLLWYGFELFLDREPITTDRV